MSDNWVLKPIYTIGVKKRGRLFRTPPESRWLLSSPSPVSQ